MKEITDGFTLLFGSPSYLYISSENCHLYIPVAIKSQYLLYNLKNRPIFIGLEPRRDQSIDCHIHWLAHACRCILVTKIRFIGSPLWKRWD